MKAKLFLKRLCYAIKIYVIVKLMIQAPPWRKSFRYAWQAAKKVIT